MDRVHGVDVSWLHTPNKEQQRRKNVTTSSTLPSDAESPVQSNTAAPQTNGDSTPETHKRAAPVAVTPPSLSEPKQNPTNAHPNNPSPSEPGKTPPRRPSLLSRSGSNKSANNDEEARGSRRPSWINNISSKFSSSQTTPQIRQSGSQQQVPTTTRSPPTSSVNTSAGAQDRTEESENVEPYVPSKPKDSGSFFSSLTRRLSSGTSQGAGTPKVQVIGGMCPRKVLNLDPNRERCLVPELDQSKLRRVSFCVDVEIASGPRYIDDEEDEGDKKRKMKEARMKERAEGEALKHPESLKEEKEEVGEVKLDAQSRAVAVPGSETKGDAKTPGDLEDDGGSPTVGSLDDGTPGMTRKKEKKKRSEAERKERKEKKLRRAQENGFVPVELTANTDEIDSIYGTPPSSIHNGSVNSLTRPGSTVSPIKQTLPTTDPVRIYRRCCQLRETPILKRITEQLMSAKSVVVNEPGVVGCLDLTGSRLQLADVVTLGDWLAVVPVKRLLMEDADINDEGVRVVLAGLLAAKRPEPTRRRASSPKHRQGPKMHSPQLERSGMVEKITFKNNPRIGRVGWKHISLFIYLCRSIKAIDLSMNLLPVTLPPGSTATQIKPPEKASVGSHQDTDAAETLCKSLSERLGGARLEELSLSECGLSTRQVRIIVDGAIMSGVSRLGLAGNNLEHGALEHVIRYLRSGVCHGLDLGGNDLRGKLESIADAINSKPNMPCWGLSLADCNLDTASVRSLFPALVKLPNFRFIDLSHNRDLCSEDNGMISLLRRYLGQMRDLKRIHLSDVGMSSKQAIALAEVLPEGPKLAHLSISENPQLTALANAMDEAGQEEACALYASLMVAVRVSSTLICIDIDVPSPDSNEIVKALAKQVVAYSLRNMEHFAIAEYTGDTEAAANAAATLTAPHGGEKQVKDIPLPDVLMHLIGHVDGSGYSSDQDDPAPDQDYIVGGTGVVKALQYVLGEKANDLRPTSISTTPVSGSLTPRERPGSSAGLQEGKAKAKEMSRDLLDSARKIRTRLQPALHKEATTGDEMAYRRLLFLDQTLQSMIQRFEEEYPETCIPPASASHSTKVPLMASHESPRASRATERSDIVSSTADDDEDDELTFRPAMSRHNSDASLASRRLTLEEGRLHRFGQYLRREVVASTPSTPIMAATQGTEIPDNFDYGDLPVPGTTARIPNAQEAQRLAVLRERLESTPGEDLRSMIDNMGWEEALRHIGANYEDLRALQEQDPEGWEQYKDAHWKARMNVQGGIGQGSAAE